MTLKERRFEKGMTQAQLSKITGVHVSNICRYEKGQGKPRPQVAKKLADVLGCTVGELMRGFEETG